MIIFKPLEGPEILEIKNQQNSDCAYDISEMIDFEPHWAPISLEELKEKLKEKQKKPRTSMFSIWTKQNNEYVGIAKWSTSWDTWCPDVTVIIWPEFRRKGYGKEAARKLLDISFLQSPGHTVVTGSQDWNATTLSFIESLGFKKCGKMRRIAMKDGEYFDLVFYDILKNEYLAGKTEVSQ